jgi:Zn-dependent protease with chaperone function
MDFFAHQESARRQSRRLIVLFALAVFAVAAAITVVVVFVVAIGQAGEGEELSGSVLERNPILPWVTAAVVLAVIGLASLWKTARLRGGGGIVARALGGTLVSPDSRDPAYRRLRNVVEEIAIASGVPVPGIYVLEREAAINAFAAGFAPGDAVVAVTRGTLDQLSRDELQGVVAHEFSHILNGDMRLNLRLMGVLFGLMLIGLAGREFLLNARGGSGGRDGAAIFLIALAVMIIGYLGLFFARLIKAGVSRQREFLADASAVQFTRQTVGIAGALKKIAAFPSGSKLETADAEEVSHMLFGDGVGYSALMATHPPLPARISRLEGRFDATALADLKRDMARKLGAVAQAPAMATPSAASDVAEAAGVAAMAAVPLPAARATIAVEPGRVAAQVANPASDDYRIAGSIHDSIPGRLVQAAGERESAPALVLALALNRDENVRSAQFETVRGQLSERDAGRMWELGAEIAELHPMQRLPLAALAFPALRRRPKPELEALLAALERLIHADGRVDLFEYCLARVVATHLREAMAPGRERPMGSARIVALKDPVALVLAVLAQHGHERAEDAAKAYAAGMTHLFRDRFPAYAPPAAWMGKLDAALMALDRLAPAGKQLLLEALVKAMSHDGRIAVAEAELLRAVCARLHCPLPPMLAA